MEVFGGHLILVMNNRARAITWNNMVFFIMHYILKLLNITILFCLIFRVLLFSSSETDWLTRLYTERGNTDIWLTQGYTVKFWGSVVVAVNFYGFCLGALSLPIYESWCSTPGPVANSLLTPWRQKVHFLGFSHGLFGAFVGPL